VIPAGTCRFADVASAADAAVLDVVPLLARGSRQAIDDTPVRFASRVLDVMIDMGEACPVAMMALAAPDEAALQAHIRELGRSVG
jgi:hypothetical protein